MLKPETIIPGLEVPNLDDLSDSDLNDACDAFNLLMRIAAGMVASRIRRKHGNVAGAMALETSVDKLYQQLPQNLRW